MQSEFPPQVTTQLDGWNLVWFRLRPTGKGENELAALRDEAVQATRDQYEGLSTSELPEVAGMRKLFRAAGTDPTRYRPSSEALLRRVMKGDPLPAIHPLVDLNNLVSLRLLAPCCVVDAGHVSPPFTFRAGGPEESMESMRGPFGLEGKPLLEDVSGPFGTPITDSERVKVRPDSDEIWLVVYLTGQADTGAVREEIESLLARAPVAELLEASV